MTRWGVWVIPSSRWLCLNHGSGIETISWWRTEEEAQAMCDHLNHQRTTIEYRVGRLANV